MLQDGFERWLDSAVGIRAAEALAPSVLCGLEAALLMGIASAEGCSMSSIMTSETIEPNGQNGIAVNGLLDSQLKPDQCAGEALRILQNAEGTLTGLKIKVGRSFSAVQICCQSMICYKLPPRQRL